MKKINNKVIADIVIYYEYNNGKKTLKWDWFSKAPRHIKNLAIYYGYNPYVYEGKDLLRKIFEKCYMIQNLSGDNSENYDTFLRSLWSEIEKHGFEPVIIPGLSGLKLGGKKRPVYFFVKPENNPFTAEFKKMGILEKINNLPWAKKFERIKKFLSLKLKPKIPPRIKIINDMKYWNGIAFAKREWMDANGIKTGDKITNWGKDIIMEAPEIMKMNCDLLIQKSGNKLNLSEEKLSELFAINPEKSAENCFSPNLQAGFDKDGNPIIGRIPNFGIDLQAWFNIQPTCDLTTVNKLLDNQIDDPDVFNTFFTYIDPVTNERCENNIYKRIKKYSLSIYDKGIVNQIYSMCHNYILRKMKLPANGVMGTAMPLSFAPKDVQQKKKLYVIVGYSGGIPVLGEASIDYERKVVWVDEKVWYLLKRDFDGDLAFVFDKKKFNMKYIATPKMIEENYIIPKKEKYEDTRSQVETLMDIKSQAILCGKSYNDTKIFIDALRMTGKYPYDVLIKTEIRAMALVEEYIMSFKDIVSSTTTRDLCEFFNIKDEEVKRNIKHISKFFFALRTVGMVPHPNPLKKNEKIHSLVRLKILSNAANPSSKSFYEKALLQFKHLNIQEVSKNENI